MDERQKWIARLNAFSEYLRHERQVGESSQRQYLSIVERWIDFVLPLGHDPATFDQGLVDKLLDQQRNLTDGSRAAYTSNLSVWCRWVFTKPLAVGQDLAATQQQHDDIAAWMARLEEYLSYLRHRGRKPSTISDRHRKLSKWIRFACSTGRNPADWDPPAIEEAFVVWGTVESPKQRDRIRRRIQRWCNYWRGTGMDGLALDGLVRQFRDDGYPDENVQHHQEARAEFESILQSLPSLSHERRHLLTSVWRATKYDYGGSGVTAGLDTTIRDVSEIDWPQMRDQIHALCYGEDDVVARFDDAMTSIKGLGELMTTRFLAITQPNRFLPNFVARSKNLKWPGKLDMIELLDRLGLLDGAEADEAQILLEAPGGSSNVGELAVRSNDALLKLLRPYFSRDDVVDTWGMAQFLYWLADRYADDDAAPDDDEDDAETGAEHERLAVALGVAAEELLCGVEFLNDIVELLEDKGQVILYGPPGTGKTYFAQRIVQALSPDSNAQALVQFHPAYSYEDFFEGFRPAVDDAGNMTYRLTPGPLVQIAERARANPEQRHVMVIDEINRANLPRVLGELLFLLEYRDRTVHTQYRPEAEFSLPENLWFIGTMNTADRSIALIDAAMRRRFHFVPFFPNHGPTAGLLRRWMAEYSPGQRWVADLVDAVNDQLTGEIGGDHLLIGPSHFMKRDLDTDSLRRIWQYNIEPLIEDQLFGCQEAIESFRFEAVWKRHGPDATSPGTQPGASDEAAAESRQASDDEGIEGQDAE